MSGLIATPCRPDMARHTPFYRSRSNLLRPPGTREELYEGFFSHQNKEIAVEDALAENRPWIFFIDDDQILHPDALMRLLAHDKDIVSCNLVTKEPPFIPYLFFATDPRGAGWPETLDQRRGLIEVAAAGMGGVLVKTDVFRAIPQPWFDVNDYLKTEDMYFFHKANIAGFRTYADLDVVSGHINPRVSVWPHWDEKAGCWRTKIHLNDNEYVLTEAAKPEPKFKAWREEMRQKLAAEQAP